MWRVWRRYDGVGKRTLGSPRNRLDDNIKVEFFRNNLARCKLD
jgi:hypothetical protein